MAADKIQLMRKRKNNMPNKLIVSLAAIGIAFAKIALSINKIQIVNENNDTNQRTEFNLKFRDSETLKKLI